MGDAPQPENAPKGDRSLLLDQLGDRLERFKLLGGADEATTDAILGEVDARGPLELRILEELAAPALAHPERFEEAHRITLRSLEVLDRHGFRDPRVPRLGPLSGLAQWAVGLMARYIVRSYTATVIDSLRNLYARREARCRPDDPQRRMLARARIQADRLERGYKGNPIGVPTVLIAFAFPLLATLGRLFTGLDIGDERVLIVGGAVLFVLFGALSWVFLRGAAVAHRRIGLTIRQPLEALWQTVGAAHVPPRDDSRTVAVVAIALTAVGWLVVPTAVGIVLATFR